MKSSRIISFLMLLICGIVISLPLIFKTIPFDYEIDIQSPVGKAYSSISSSYEDLFLSSEVEIIRKWDREITNAVENEKLETHVKNGKLNIHSAIDFIDRTKITRLRIHEDISFDSWFNHAFGVIFSSSIIKKRENHYIRVKQGIESTPDATIKPEEIK